MKECCKYKISQCFKFSIVAIAKSKSQLQSNTTMITSTTFILLTTKKEGLRKYQIMKYVVIVNDLTIIM